MPDESLISPSPWRISQLTSTIALHIIGLVKSLPREEQEAVRAGLERSPVAATESKKPFFVRTPDGGYYNPNGLSDDDPFFKIMEEIEASRHHYHGRAIPEFD